MRTGNAFGERFLPEGGDYLRLCMPGVCRQLGVHMAEPDESSMIVLPEYVMSLKLETARDVLTLSTGGCEDHRRSF